MSDQPDVPVHEIKKYPNRRFYDATDRRPVTLADLYDLVRKGRQIMVHDSKTGDDITNVVLAQIILEHDPPKMELFPSSLLHQTIQANQQVVRNFISEYFAQAMNAFVTSRQRFDDFLQQAGRHFMSPMAPLEWARSFFDSNRTGTPSSRTPAEARPPSSREDEVADLRARLDSMSEELNALRNQKRSPGEPRRSAPQSKKKKRQK